MLLACLTKNKLQLPLVSISDSLDVKGHEGVGLLSVLLAVVEQDLLAADNYVL